MAENANANEKLADNINLLAKVIGTLNADVGRGISLATVGLQLYNHYFGSRDGVSQGISQSAAELERLRKLAEKEAKYASTARSVANKQLIKGDKSTSSLRGDAEAPPPPLSGADGLIGVFLDTLKHFLPKVPIAFDNSHFSALLMAVTKVTPGTNTKDKLSSTFSGVGGALLDALGKFDIKHTPATNAVATIGSTFGVQLDGNITSGKRKTLHDTIQNVESMKRQRHARYRGERPKTEYNKDYDYVLATSLMLDLVDVSVLPESMDLESIFQSFVAHIRNLRDNKKKAIRLVSTTSDRIQQLNRYIAHLYVDMSVHTSIMLDKRKLYDITLNEPLFNKLSRPLDDVAVNTASIPLIARDPNWRVTKNSNLQDIHGSILAEEDILNDIKAKLMKHVEEKQAISEEADAVFREAEYADKIFTNSFVNIAHNYLNDRAILSEFLVDAGCDLDSFMQSCQALIDIYIDEACAEYKENTDALVLINNQHLNLTTKEERVLDIWSSAVRNSVHTYGVLWQSKKEVDYKKQSVKHSSMADLFDENIRKFDTMLTAANVHINALKFEYNRENDKFQKTNTNNLHSLSTITQILKPLLPNVNEYNLEETFSAMSLMMKQDLVKSIALSIKINEKMKGLTNAIKTADAYIQSIQAQISKITTLKMQLIDNMQDNIISYLTSQFRNYYTQNHHIDQYVQLCEAIRLDLSNWRADAYSDESKLLRIQMWNNRTATLCIPDLSRGFAPKTGIPTPVLESGSKRLYAPKWNLPVKPFLLS